MSVQIVSRTQVEAVVTTEHQQVSFQNDLREAIANGFIQFDASKFYAAPIQTLGTELPFATDSTDEQEQLYAAQTCVKSGYFSNSKYFVIKVASGGYPWPTNSGNIQVYSQKTGQLMALLLDEGILTEMRTAAVGALVVERWLRAKTTTTAPSGGGGGDIIQCVGMVGTGVQARYQIEWIQNVTTCRSLVVYGRTPEKVQTYMNEMRQEKYGGWTVRSVNQADDLLEQCDVIITTTSARSPVLGTTTISGTAGTTTQSSSRKFRCRLLICIGSDAPGKMELSDSLIASATCLIADHPPQSQERGEFQQRRGCVPADDDKRSSSISLGQFVQNPCDVVTDDADGLTIFDSSGVALQDCIIAQMVLDRILSSSKKKS